MISRTIFLIALTVGMSGGIRAEGPLISAGSGEKDSEIGRADTIFVGRVISIHGGGPDVDPAIGIHYDEEVKVSKVLRGSVEQNVYLSPAYSPNAEPPKAGDTFIFYTQKNATGWFKFKILKFVPVPESAAKKS